MITETEMIVRQSVVCASGLVYWGGVIVMARWVRRKIGRSPNLKPKGVKERLLWLAWLAVILVWIGQPLAIGRVHNVMLEFIAPLANSWLMVAGLAMVALGHLCTWWCYRSLGASWRIGVRKGEKTNLVESGPYARIRHPIYGFQLLILIGAALLLPTLLSLLALAVHLVSCYIKAIDEETFLATVHGQPYRDYCARTWRFVPRIRLS